MRSLSKNLFKNYSKNQFFFIWHTVASHQICENSCNNTISEWILSDFVSGASHHPLLTMTKKQKFDSYQAQEYLDLKLLKNLLRNL